VKASYLELHRSGELKARTRRAVSALGECRLCPRQCGANRLNDERGYCRTGRRARIASASPHFGEERPLVGQNGSGTLFFGYCNLFCSFCQNYDISHTDAGVEAQPGDLADIMLALQDRGCHNINLVTPSHVVPQILEGLLAAVERGLNVPLVYNSGGYDRVETIEGLDGIVDIYMPDFKFWEPRWAERCCEARD
jgi:putative pyruvate formate lyase activating enzyme